MDQQNMPSIAKKIWKIVKVAIFMLKKGISKRKIMLDLNMMMKRGKIAGKALGNLMFHHHHHGGATPSHGYDQTHLPYVANPACDYEFSCSSTPLYRQYFTKRKNKHNVKHDQDVQLYMDDVNKMLENIISNDIVSGSRSESVSGFSPLPGLGFGQSPTPARQLRITDSPYPIYNDKEDNGVDEKAEKFIKGFYSQLKQQNFY